jgi:hypothetical protein
MGTSARSTGNRRSSRIVRRWKWLASRRSRSCSISSFLAENPAGEFAGHWPAPRAERAGAPQPPHHHSHSRHNSGFFAVGTVQGGTQSRPASVRTDRNSRIHRSSCSPKAKPADAHAVSNRGHAGADSNRASRILRRKRATGRRSVGFVDGKLLVRRKPDSFCATPHPLGTSEWLAAKVRVRAQLPGRTNANGNRPHLRLAFSSFIRSRSIGILTAPGSRHGLVLWEPETSGRAQARLDRTRSRCDLRSCTHRRIPPKPARISRALEVDAFSAIGYKPIGAPDGSHPPVIRLSAPGSTDVYPEAGFQGSTLLTPQPNLPETPGQFTPIRG